MINAKIVNLRFNQIVWKPVQFLSGLTTYLLFTNPVQALTCVDLLVTPVSFGTYNPSSGSNLTSTGGVKINKFFDCLFPSQLIPTNFTIKLSAGNAGTYSPRKMNNPVNLLAPLQYNLYTTGGVGAPIWGDGTGGSTVVSSNGSSNINIPIYGVVSSGQNPSIGSYSDSLTVTIEFN